jgi:hypothetical protein
MSLLLTGPLKTWQNPELLAQNRLSARATTFPLSDGGGRAA